MPLLIVTGYPSSGKSTLVERILHEFKSKGVEVVHVRDDDNPSYSAEDYGDFKKEKENRGFLRSSVQRAVAKERLVICDSLNYIKGFRYELYCAGKSTETTYALLYCNAEPDSCRWFNSQKSEEKLKYPEQVLENIMTRYEVPDRKSRWDSPLIEVNVSHSDKERTPAEVALPLDELYSLLIMGEPMKANVSTQSLMPRMSTTFLTELDSVTQKIIDSLLEKQRMAVPGDKLLVIPCHDGNRGDSENNRVDFTRTRSIGELNRLRTQFIKYTRTHPLKDFELIASLFVNFLNANP